MRIPVTISPGSRRVLRDPVGHEEVPHRHLATPSGPAEHGHGIQRHEHGRRVRRMGRDALLARRLVTWQTSPSFFRQ